jgi:hypothetical protein
VGGIGTTPALAAAYTPHLTAATPALPVATPGLGDGMAGGVGLDNFHLWHGLVVELPSGAAAEVLGVGAAPGTLRVVRGAFPQSDAPCNFVRIP